MHTSIPNVFRNVNKQKALTYLKISQSFCHFKRTWFVRNLYDVFYRTWCNTRHVQVLNRNFVSAEKKKLIETTEIVGNFWLCLALWLCTKLGVTINVRNDFFAGKLNSTCGKTFIEGYSSIRHHLTKGAVL